MPYFDIGERIKEIRKNRNLNQDQLAEMASLNRVTVAKYESGRIEPGAQALGRIADALEVSTDVLLGRETVPDQLPETQAPKTKESKLISGAVDTMPQEDRERALNMMKAVYSEYFDRTEEKNA